MFAFRYLVALFLGLLLSGCNPFSRATPMMDEYVDRVARVLEQEPFYSDLPPASNLPRRRDRRLTLPELELGMLDFLSLYGCELQYVIGEKNSVMGKVMQPLNRLRYELRFIEAAEDCLPEISREGVKESLTKAIESKKETLPIVLWNATWGVREIENLFTLAKGDYPIDPKGQPVSDLSIDADRLNDVAGKLLQGNYDQDLGFLGEVQQRWQAEYRAGQLINSARLLIARLDDASRLLKQRINGRPLCIDGKPNNQASIVQSMFFSVYIEKVQPYMSDIRQARDALIQPLGKLAAMQSETMPASFQSWYQRHLVMTGETSLWLELDSAMAEHTRLWQTLLEQCGLRPQA